MQNKDTFSSYHPFVNFLYFCFVLGFSMFLMHPVCLAVSLFCAVFYHGRLNGKKSLGFMIKFALPMLLLTAIINSAFNHRGTAVLCYLPTGNPLTLESVLYGISAGVMLVSVLLWFGCFNAVMSSDKLIYLFGKVIPSLSLLISMILRFVPNFKKQFESIKEAQTGIGRDLSNGSLLQRLKNVLNCFSIMVTWSLENAIDTADSMKSRGYGLKGRTAFSNYKFADKDTYCLIWLSFCAVYLLSGIVSGNLYWRYFPSIKGVTLEPFTISFLIVYLAMCITPIVINKREDKKWKALESKI
ncbi:MAG: energy-coupling factor transporter transmembrane protein EcfT [Eubacterium sp.]|nr:energy-coupling factor transporter transmembrane protein EcfT [Eubacterium sp.]